MRLRPLWTGMLLVAVFARPCRAEDEYAVARARAQQVSASGGPGAAEALLRLAREQDPDPWLVVDALLEAGAAEAAKAFAAAYEGIDAPALRAVAGRHLVGSPDQRAALARAEARLADGAGSGADAASVGEDVARLLQDVESITPGVLRVHWLEHRAEALARSERLRDAARDLTSAQEVATRIGWLRKASALGWAAGDMAFRDHDLRGMLGIYTRLASVLRRAGDARGEASALANVAEVHLRFGETQEALGRLQDALDALGAAGEPRLAATLRSRHGAALVRLGRRAAGQRELEAALAELRAEGAVLEAADAETDLGHLLLDLGDLRGARRAFESARTGYLDVPADADDSLREKHAAGLAAAESNLASVLLLEREFDAAVESILRQRERFQALGDRANAGRSLQLVADARVKQARSQGPSADRRRWLDEARAHAIAAEAEAVSELDAEGVLYARASRGDVEETSGHRQEATRIFEDVVKEATERGLVALTIEYSVALARVRLDAGNVGGALEAVEAGLHRIDDAYDEQGAQSRVAAHERHAELYEIGARAALRLPEAEAIARLFRYVEIGRASTLLDAIENRDTLRGRGVPPALERERVDAARSVVEARRALDGAGDSMARIRSARDRLAREQARYEAAVDAIQAEARVAANLLYPQPLTLVEARSMLAPAQVLVLYAGVGTEAYAIVLSNEASRLVALGPLDPALEASRATLAVGAGVETVPAGSAARALVVEPVLASLPASTRTVYVSPDGDLGLVPFPALLPEGARTTVLLVPSASTLRLLLDQRARVGTGTLAVGIAKYGATASLGAAPMRSPALLDLDRAEAEATAVGSERLLGARATERGFFAALSKQRAWSAVHFAVHGVLDPRNPSLSCLALVPDAEDDGDLTAFELLQHEVRADVAVLAACESGGGVHVRGEGLVGLVRALFFAGCPRVVANLWSADDGAAEAFSVAFHRAWRDPDATLGSALEAGRAAVRQNARWRHPFYWAGWCGWGPP